MCKLWIEQYILNIRNNYDKSMVAKLHCAISQLCVDSGMFNQPVSITEHVTLVMIED
jgi:hypothetical protein